MHEITLSPAADKAALYAQLLPQLEALIAADPDLPTAALANTCAVLKETFGWLWIGFYLTDADGTELTLGPFQGPLACTRIAKGRGVCGQAWAQNRTLVVDDVLSHPDHIACSARSRSEIVVPLRRADGRIVGVLDADAEQTAAFDGDDAYGLEQLCALLGRTLAL